MGADREAIRSSAKAALREKFLWFEASPKDVLALLANLDAAERRVAALEAEVKRHRADTKRLMWIEANINRDASGAEAPFIGSVVLQEALLQCPPMGSKYPHLRAAIDALLDGQATTAPSGGAGGAR